jgi:radical SAM protein with 4Fe4S-binding SPASM domain
MSEDLINKVLDECEQHRDEIECVVPYVNNEPFLDKRMIDVLRNIRRRGLKVELSTNASALTEEVARAIVDEDLINDFRISFFASNKEDYSVLMPRLDYDKVVKNIKYFAEYNRQHGNKIHTNIIMILLDYMDMQKNIDDVKELFGIEVRVFGYLDRAGANDKKNELLSEEEMSGGKLVGCSTRRPNEWFSILANGDVYLCTQDWHRENKIGNVANDSIINVWNCEKYKWYRDVIFGKIDTPEDFICKKCKIAIYNDSKANKLNFAGDKYVDKEGVKHVTV